MADRFLAACSNARRFHRFVIIVKKAFKSIILVPFVLVSVEENIRREIRRKFPHLNSKLQMGCVW